MVNETKTIRDHKPKNGPKSIKPASAGADGKVIIFKVKRPAEIRQPIHPNSLLKLELLAMLIPNKNHDMAMKISKATSNPACTLFTPLKDASNNDFASSEVAASIAVSCHIKFAC